MLLPPGPVHLLADALTGVAVLVVVVALVRGGGRPREAPALLAGALGLGMEFLLAGGLLRLAVTTTWAALATAALVVVVRKVAATGIHLALRVPPAGRRAPGARADALRDR